MPGIRTVFVGLSPLLGDLVRLAIVSRAPLRVIGVLDSRARLLQRLRFLAPTLVVIGLDPDEDDAIAAQLALALAGVRILALAANVRFAALHEAGQPRRLLPNPSPRELIEAIRKA